MDLNTGKGEAKERRRKPPSPVPGPLPLSAFSQTGKNAEKGMLFQKRGSLNESQILEKALPHLV